MLFSIALIVLMGLVLGQLCTMLRLPRLIGMIITGIALGPYVLGIIDQSLLDISAEIRQAALIIILLRAGLNLEIKDLKKNGASALLMCFLPACFEICGMVLLAPLLLGTSIKESLLMGSVVAAVSPAVIVPKMLSLMEKGYGTKKGIPQLILAGASVDDIFVIVLFTAFTALAQGRDISPMSFLQIPVSILLGLGVGCVLGLALSAFFKAVSIDNTVRALIVLSLAFMLVSAEAAVKAYVPFSGLLAVMGVGLSLRKNHIDAAIKLSSVFSKIWVGAEIMLFALVGACVDIKYAAGAGFTAVILILSVLVFRAVGVVLCMLKARLNFKEKLFCVIAYLPKATVQAAIGAVPLSLGLSCGKTVLTVAVLSILITAPLGALGIDCVYKRFLEKEGP